MTAAPKKTGAVRVGLLGAGLMGSTHSLMLKALNDRLDTDIAIVSIYDPKAQLATQLAGYWNAKVARSADEIFADSSVDAVWICTPTRFHRNLAKSAASAAKHVFIEKPLAMNGAEAIEIAEALRSAPILSQVGLVLRFSPVFTTICQMITEQRAGRIFSVTMRDDQDFPIRGAHPTQWRNDPELTAGGTLIEHGVHDFDLLRWLGGPVRSIYCRTRNLNGAPGVEDFGAVDFEFESGAHGQMVSIWHNIGGRPSNRRLEVFAENLFVATDDDIVGPIVMQQGGGPEHLIDRDEVLRNFAATLESERPHLAMLQDLIGVPYALEDANFIQAIRGRCEAEPEIALGVQAQLLVDAAYESARTNQRVLQRVSIDGRAFGAASSERRFPRTA
jgi:predicted dehydrogenase